MHQAIQGDRIWFQQHPQAIIRFRAADPGEFAELLAVGEKPPIFRPSTCRANSRLNWVAVVNLVRLADSEHFSSEESTLRLRICIPAIRTTKRQKLVEKELLHAVATELLDVFKVSSSTIAA